MHNGNDEDTGSIECYIMRIMCSSRGFLLLCGQLPIFKTWSASDRIVFLNNLSS